MKRKSIKRITIILCILLTVGMFGGCGSKEGYTIGITQIADHPSLDNCREGFIEGLKQEGFEEGKNLTITYQGANNDGTTQNNIVQSFVSNKVDLICAIATPSAQAAYNAAQPAGIPVIFTAVSDPVAAKLATSQDDAIEGVTGTNDQLPIEAQLKMIRALLPEAKKIGILYNTSEVNSTSQIAIFEEMAGTYGFEIVTSGISTADELPLACDKLLMEVDCITNLTDNLVVQNLPVLLGKADAANIPVFGSEEEQVKNGCLATEGLDYFALGVQTGKMAAKVLKGEDINSIKIETLKDCQFFVNQEKLEKFQITLPQEYQDRASTF